MYYIADKIMEMTLDIYENTQQLVDDISGLGLRHVGSLCQSWGNIFYIFKGT